ncbi:MAG: hypothetical protein SFY67_01085 [Candidatus Melainabacteria bacterium]|nr:hypothetical protein [Candidatus Melainabacteria bacterium]
MFQLSSEDFDYFSKDEVWHKGPMLQLELVFEDGFDLQKIDSVIRGIPNFQFWSETGFDDSYHAIFSLSDQTAIGTRNCMFHRNLEIRRAIFEIAIRPPQYEKLIGSRPDGDHSQESSAKLRTLVKSFEEITNLVESRYPLLFAYVSSELDSSLYTAGNRFYISPEVSKNLGSAANDFQKNNQGFSSISFAELGKRLHDGYTILKLKSPE